MKTMYKQYQITSVYKGTKSWNCMKDNYNNHMIYITNKETNKKCKVNPKKKECVTPGWLNTNITSEQNTDEDIELNNILEESRK